MIEQTSKLEALFFPVSINLLFKHMTDILVQAYLRLSVTRHIQFNNKTANNVLRAKTITNAFFAFKM